MKILMKVPQTVWEFLRLSYNFINGILLPRGNV